MIRTFSLALATLTLCSTISFADELKIEDVKASPEGIAAPILEKLSDTCTRVTGENGIICEIWFAREVNVKADFKATLSVKYPFTSGQLIGAIRLPTEGAATDFKGQQLPTGTFTLRYGQQPQDGNHLGTSDVSDFLLACVADQDKTPDVIPNKKDLFKLSATAADTNHPAIFLLVPPQDKPAEKKSLEHNEEKELWILNTSVTDGKQQQPLRVVVYGYAEG